MRTGMAIALLLALFASGCGYELIRHDKPADAVPRVAIRTLANESDDPGAEMIVSEALRREFLGRRGSQLVTNPARADWVIDGTLLPLRTDAETVSSVVLALEYTLIMAVELEIKGPAGQRVALDGASLQESELYLANADIEITRKNREEALRRLASLIAGRVHDAFELEVTR